ncbi:MAG: hypothetical protein Q9167_003066 [Letrouitia subvulpina]
MLRCPAYSFLIEHPGDGRKLLFDLGVRKDWENLSPSIVKHIKAWNAKVSVEKGVAEILEEGGVNPQEIEAIIWSHYHWDHTGDPSTFPPSTDLIVGPGFKKAILPGWPANPDSPIRESDYEGRNLREISFATDLQMGGCRAFDFFGDGSLYLLDTPGHAIGHMCALARTTASPATFMFLGGDCAHSASEFRPSAGLPLPSTITPSPLVNIHPHVCPGALFIPIHRLYSPANRTSTIDMPTTEPFMIPAKGGAYNVDESRDSAIKMSNFDANEKIFTMIAHDDTLMDIVEYFPTATANQWKEKGWRERGLWKFLRKFEEAVKEAEIKGREHTQNESTKT